MSDKKKLNLNRENIKSNNKPMTQEEATIAMGEFYSVMGNCALNLVAITQAINFNLEQIMYELSDIKDNLNKMGIQDGWLSQFDIDEREKEEDGPEPNDK